MESTKSLENIIRFIHSFMSVSKIKLSLFRAIQAIR